MIRIKNAVIGLGTLLTIAQPMQILAETLPEVTTNTEVTTEASTEIIFDREISESEINDAKVNMDNFESYVKKYEEKLTLINNDITDLNFKITRQKNLITAISKDNDTYISNITALQEQLATLEAQLNNLKMEYAVEYDRITNESTINQTVEFQQYVAAKQNLDNIQAVLAQKEAEYNSLTTQLAEQQQALQNHEAALERAINELHAAENAKTQAEQKYAAISSSYSNSNATNQDLIAKYELEYNNAKNTLAEAEQSLNAAKEELKKLSDSMNNTMSKDELLKQKSELETAIDTLTNEYNTELNNHTNLVNENGGTDTQKATLEQELLTLQQTSSTIDQNLQTNQNEIDALNNTINQLNSELANLQNSITDLQNQLAAIEPPMPTDTAEENVNNAQTNYDSAVETYNTAIDLYNGGIFAFHDTLTPIYDITTYRQNTEESNKSIEESNNESMENTDEELLVNPDLYNYTNSINENDASNLDSILLSLDFIDKINTEFRTAELLDPLVLIPSDIEKAVYNTNYYKNVDDLIKSDLQNNVLIYLPVNPETANTITDVLDIYYSYLLIEKENYDKYVKDTINEYNNWYDSLSEIDKNAFEDTNESNWLDENNNVILPQDRFINQEDTDFYNTITETLNNLQIEYPYKEYLNFINSDSTVFGMGITKLTNTIDTTTIDFNKTAIYSPNIDPNSIITIQSSFIAGTVEIYSISQTFDNKGDNLILSIDEYRQLLNDYINNTIALDQKQQDIDTANQLLVEAQQELQNIIDTNAANAAQRETIQANIDSINNQIIEKQTALNNANTDLDQHNIDKTSLIAQKESNDAQIVEKTNAIDELANNINDKQVQIDNHQSTIDNKLAELNAKKQELEEINNKINAIDSDKTKNETELKNLEVDVANKQAIYNNALNIYKHAETNYNKITGEVSTVETNKAAIENELAIITNTVAEKQADVNNLQAAIQTLTANIENINNTLTVVAAQQADLQANLGPSQTSFAQAQEVLNALLSNSKLIEIENSINQLQEEYNNTQNKLNEFKANPTNIDKTAQLEAEKKTLSDYEATLSKVNEDLVENTTLYNNAKRNYDNAVNYYNQLLKAYNEQQNKNLNPTESTSETLENESTTANTNSGVDVNAVKTGDTTNILLWIGLIFGSVIVIGIVVYFARKYYVENYK